MTPFIQFGAGVVLTKIPGDAYTIYNCAYKNDTMGAIISGGSSNLGSVNDIYTQKLPLGELITFRCFCRLNKRYLNGCAIRIGSYFDDEQHDFYMGTCKGGEIDFSVKENIDRDTRLGKITR